MENASQHSAEKSFRRAPHSLKGKGFSPYIYSAKGVRF